MTKELLEKIFSDLAGGGEKLQRFLKFAQDGKVSAVENYCANHGRCGHLTEDKTALIKSMIDELQKYRTILPVLEVVAKQFDFQKFFMLNPQIAERHVLGLYANNSTPEVAKAGAILTAEFLRAKITTNPAYSLDVSAILKDSSSNNGTLRSETQKASLRDSIIATQNALVSYVTEEGPGLPLNRAAAILPILVQDEKTKASRDLSLFWSQKITSFRDTTVYTADMGDVPVVRPVFEVPNV